MYVDDDLCQGHNLCMRDAPAVFLHREEDGHAVLASHEVPVADEAAVRRAVGSCPERAIRIVE